MVLTDESALNNPGPTGAGAVIYLDGYETNPILLKKGVNPVRNNYTGDLVGIQIALEFLADLTENNNLRNRTIYIFTDCQAAIISSFNNAIPKNKIDIILPIKEFLRRLSDKNILIEVHRVPGHNNIKGNGLADIQAKEAAKEMIGADIEDFPIKIDKGEAVQEIKKNLKIYNTIQYNIFIQQLNIYNNVYSLQNKYK